MEQALTIIATIASVALVLWAMVINPAEAGAKPGNDAQLSGLLTVILAIAAIVVVVVFALPYLGMIAMTLVLIALAALLLFVFWKIGRPLLPRLYRGLRSLVHVLRKHAPPIARRMMYLLRRAIAVTMRGIRWILKPSRWQRIARIVMRGIFRIARTLTTIARRIRVRIPRFHLPRTRWHRTGGPTRWTMAQLTRDDRQGSHGSRLAEE